MKQCVGIICGGQSPEHEVSLRSAKTIYDAISREQYEPVVIWVSYEGGWYLMDAEHAFLVDSDHKKQFGKKVTFFPEGAGQLLFLEGGFGPKLDVVFPIIHGPTGEDGTLQGVLRTVHVPFVGPSVLGSAVGMDKEVMKRLLRDAGLPIPKFLVVRKDEAHTLEFSFVVEQLGLPLFVKPANMGSSVGVHKVTTISEWTQALEDAFLYDNKLLVEEAISGREVECSVQGYHSAVASRVGEIIPQHQFYSYEAKYVDEQGADTAIPAHISKEKEDEIRTLSCRAYTALCCDGMGRVDMFLQDDGKVLVNEINTLPGFTSISMYPKLWEAAGVPISELISLLITDAFARWEDEQQRKVVRGK